MQDRLDLHRRENHGHRRARGLRTRLIGVGVISAAALVSIARMAAAQDVGGMPGFEGGTIDSGAAPMMNSGGGSFFSQDLGTILRLRYNTESYGQDDRGNLDIGTMQVLSFDDSIAFFDGQLTLNDVNGPGFNLGLGYRWLGMVPGAVQDPLVVNGISVWADGTNTAADNFFPQVGVSYESLGDMWDLRANGYIPLGPQEQTGKFKPTGVIGFERNFISELTQATIDSSFYAADAEIARRLGQERDAWAFGGPYFLSNDSDDTLGYRAGVRGYAYPDLMLQIAVSHDDIFATNAAFSITWFVGRTRTNFQPACGVPDRMREPVLRNDYVALSKRTTTGGNPLNDANGDPLRVVHVDSNAPAGGDGTFEHPLNALANVNGNSQDGDIVYVHAQSVFNGGAGAVLQDNQRFLGEGNDFNHVVVTEQDGTISIPESSPGAKALARPMILAALGDAVTLADANEVTNFDIDGQSITSRAIVAGSNGSGNPIIRELSIKNTTGDGIVLTPFVRTDTTDPSLKTVAFNVNISKVTFENIGGDDINLNAFTTTDVTDPNVTLQEAISLTDLTSNNGNGRGLFVQNTHEAGTVTVRNYDSTGASAPDGRMRFEGIAGDVTINDATISGGAGFAADFFDVKSTSAVVIDGLDYDGGAAAAGGIRADTFDGTLTTRNTKLAGGTLEGISLLNKSDGTFTFESTVTFESVLGTTFLIDGGALNQFTGSATLTSDITNDTGLSVSLNGISGVGTTVTLNGDITDTGQGIRVFNNTGGLILFSGMLDMDTTTNDAVRLTNNTGADISFGGLMDINTTTGAGFTATGGGTVTASNTSNKIKTTTGRVAEITGMTISGAGVNFSEINRTASAANEAVLLANNTGGPILLGTVGDNAGDSGTIVGGTVDAIVIRNSANVTVSGLKINNTNAVSGVLVDKSTNTAMTVNLNDLEINAGDIGLEVTGHGTTANLVMTVNDTDVIGSTAIGMSFDDVDNGTVQVNNATVDGNGDAATAGIRVLNSNASFTFDTNTEIQEVDGADILVDGGTGTVNAAAKITNTVGRSIVVQNTTGGTKNFTGDVTDTGTGILVTGNSNNATINVTGTYDLDTTTADAVTVTNNTGAIINIDSLDITTTSGAGFVATGGGTLAVTGTTNKITTTTGVGLDIEDMTIGGSGVQFQSVNVSNGATNGIILENLTGGQVSVGNVGTAQNAGGTLTTTGDAIVVTNVQNVDLRSIQVASSGGVGLNVTHSNTNTTAMDVTVDNLNLDSSTGNGVSVAGQSTTNAFTMRFTNGDLEENFVTSVTGSALFQLRVETTSINTTGTTDAFSTTLSGSATNASMILNDVNFTSGNASALFIDMSGGTAKTLNLLVQDSDFINNSATNAASEILTRDSSTLSATIQGNSFDNASGAVGASDFLMTADGAAARVRLNLGGDTAADFNSANGVGVYDLVKVPGGADFDVFKKADLFLNLRNNGTVSPQSPAGVANPAAFDDLPVAPVPPVIP